MKTALITGIFGQDGSYLAELLLNKGYKVHGIARNVRSVFKNQSQCKIHVGDLTKGDFLKQVMTEVCPDELYHLATCHEVGLSYHDYLKTRELDTDCTVHFLNLIDQLALKTRFFHASSSLIFGDASQSPQCESTPFAPNTVYGVCKVASMQMIQLFRQQKGIFGCSGILFNHESPRRNEFFLTRKITRTAARIKLGLETQLILGDLDSRRDWGYAGDYVEAMWMMLQTNSPQDFVIGTGKTHSVRDVLEVVFTNLNLDWRHFVKSDPQFLRAKELSERIADNSKIKGELGWMPKTTFAEMLRQMVQNDLQLLEKK